MNVKNMPVPGLKTCVNFLGFNLPNSVFQCLQRNQEGSFHRPKRYSVEIYKIIQNLREIKFSDLKASFEVAKSKNQK